MFPVRYWPAADGPGSALWRVRVALRSGLSAVHRIGGELSSLGCCHLWTAPSLQGWIWAEALICRGAVICPACWRGTMTAGPDGVRGSGPSQSIELKAPDSISGCPGLAAAFRSSPSALVHPYRLELRPRRCCWITPSLGLDRRRRARARPRRCGQSCWPWPR